MLVLKEYLATLNCIKTKSRNRLITSTVAATVIVSECIKKGNGNCINFQTNNIMFDNMTYTSLYLLGFIKILKYLIKTENSSYYLLYYV